MKLYCIVGKTCSGKDYIGQKISHIYNIPKTSVSELIKNFCIKEGITPNRENMIKLGNTNKFTGKNIAQQFEKNLQKGGVITGIRKPETLSELQKCFDVVVIGTITNNNIRYSRYISRLGPDNTKDKYKSFEDFINDENIENSRPNKQSVQMVMNMSDIYIHNNGSKINIQKSLIHKPKKTENISNVYIDKQGYTHLARAIIKNKSGKILLINDKNKGYHALPGGKLCKFENPQEAVIRELHEKLGITNIDKIQYLGGIGGKYPDGFSKGHYFEVIINDKPQNMEKDKIKSIGYYNSKKLDTKNYINIGIYHYENNGRFDNLDLAEESNILQKIHRI